MTMTKMLADAALAPRTSQSKLEWVMDTLVAEANESIEEMGAVRKQYEDRRGNVHQDEELWEAWSAGFVDWLVVEHPANIALTRAARWRRDGYGLASKYAYAIARSHRSLFEIAAMPAGRVDVIDLLGGAAFSVNEPRSLAGVEVGDIAELRLIGIENEVLFGKTFVYHPKSARNEIVERASAIMSAAGTRNSAIDAIATLRAYVPRYRHLSPLRVYQMADKLL
jgi:hypothetical protein